jgi:hypothetical protein
MKLYKLKAEISVNSAIAEEMGNFMSRMDLGITGIEAPMTEIVSWTTTTKPTDEYKKNIEKVIERGFEKDGARLISIKWL